MYYTSSDDIYNQMKVYVQNTDTSENSYVFNSLYPSAMEIAYCLLLMDQVENKVFASKAITSGYSAYLEARINEVGVYRKQATYAQLNVTFTGKIGTKIPQGYIVSTNDNRNYTTISECVIGTDGTITVQVIAEKAGSNYNVKAGDINYLPVKYTGITSVINKSDYQDAYDTESDLDFYNRYLLKIQKPATSGNIHNYEEWCLSVTGVGSVKVLPLTDENLQKKNGHVTCVITDSNKEPASASLIKSVQDYVAPTGESNGGGEAPIGATVHIISVEGVILNITANVSINTGTIDDVKTTFINNIKSYIKNTVFTSKKVTLKKVESFLMDINAVDDCSNLKINGSEENIILSDIQVAVLGTVTLNLI
jgi:uncharacterized phage protein gp47/JayE